MEQIKAIYDFLNIYINVNYLIAFILISYAIGKRINTPFITKWNVFIIATILGIIFYLIGEQDIIKLIISYALGTSLHEILVKFIIDLCNNNLNKNLKEYK